MIVVDANVAAKWYLPEADSAAAVALQEGQDQLVAPELIRLEVAASITRRVWAEKKEERLAPDLALSRCAKWFRLLDQGNLSLIPEAELMQEATNLSVKIKHTMHDCLYLAAARMHRAPLITADEPFQKRAAVHYPDIHLPAKWRMN
jgi:predicted nucleic acid-binding protein